VAAAPTPAAWSEGGPEVLWRRPVGDGYSSVAVVGGTLYTMQRDEDREVVLALAAESGEMLWARAYEAPIPDYMKLDYGPGPYATPLVLEERLFTTGVRGTLLALDRKSGEILWRRELIDELGGTTDIRGYPASPVAFEDLLILPVGGEGRSLVAFRQSDGEIVWKAGDLPNAMSSVRVIERDGDAQAVVQLNGAVLGVDPRAGDLLWTWPHAAERGHRNIVLPLFDESGHLLVSSQRGGTRLLELGSLDGLEEPRELWHTNQVRFHFTSPVRFRDVVYGSSGDFGPVPLTAIRVDDGEILWRSREFARANLVRVGERALVLDEDCELALISLSPDGVEVHARAQLLEETCWTPPSVVGDRAYLRNRSEIVAVELPAAE
jgi:outer membrane protein assembly factor BamB